MERSGRFAGIGLGVLVSVAVALLAAAGTGWTGRELFVASSGIGFLLTLVPLGWHLGGKYDRMKERSVRDSLTCAYNRRFIEECFLRLSEQALRRNKKMTVTLIDVNDFKLINDTYGHLTGDHVLTRIVEALKERADRGEIVGRWGGDEFLLLSPYVERGAASSLHEQIGAKLESLSQSENKRVTVSIGSSVFPDDGVTLKQLVDNADWKMYEDKNRNKQEEALSPIRMNA
jgi:diguanylate cyclase (GGDEF) domain